MKITKSQLQKIIKEEMEAMMGQVTIGDEVDVIGGVMVGAVGEILAISLKSSMSRLITHKVVQVFML